MELMDGQSIFGISPILRLNLSLLLSPSYFVDFVTRYLFGRDVADIF
jgi:hypothetical protein